MCGWLLYTGYTTDVEKRLKTHNAALGKGAKYTRARLPLNFFTKNPIQINPAIFAEALLKTRQAKAKLYQRTVGLNSPTVFIYKNGDMVLVTPCLLRSQLDHTPFYLRRNLLLQMWKYPSKALKQWKGPFVIGRPKDELLKICKGKFQTLPDFVRGAAQIWRLIDLKRYIFFSNSSWRKGKLRLWSKNGVRCRRSTKPVSREQERNAVFLLSKINCSLHSLHLGSGTTKGLMPSDEGMTWSLDS